MYPLLPSGLAGSGSQEEGASLTFTGGNTTGNGEREEEKDAMLGVLIELVVLLPPSTVSVVIDAYTHNSTLASGDSVPLGTQLILVCHVVSLPYGMKLRYTAAHTSTSPLTFTWICPNGVCFIAQRYGRRFYKNNFILAITTISTTYSGTYTCQVTDAGGQQAKASFMFSIPGKYHSTKYVHARRLQLPCFLYSKWSLLTTYIYCLICTHNNLSI